MGIKRLNFICFILAAVFAVITVLAVSQMAAEAVNDAYATTATAPVASYGTRHTWR